jgi:acyl-CoA oxidase
MGFFGLGNAVKCLIHYLLYIKTILTFMCNDYHKELLADTTNLTFENIGSFSLTELHHGSYSRGIATLAIYDPETKEWVISTQGEKGMKFWIGALAATASMTIMWAQLIVGGRNYGPHPFLIRIRDRITHQVLKGIIIGDCGPKNGLDTIDNGYAMMENVRVPREALLGRLGYVDESGQYHSHVKSNEQRFGLHMSPLSTGRANLAMTSLTQSIASLAIAIRFACNRRQFKLEVNSPSETLIIDYPSVRYRLMVPLATTIVYYFAGFRIVDLYIKNTPHFTDPTKKIVGELHALSAILKCKASWFTSATITECRELLGGHGYSSFSNLGAYYNNNDVNTTWEGDNYVLLQSTSRFLLKSIPAK